MTITDRDLVVAFKHGDVRAYASIYREYRPVAEAICQRILGNPEDAAEAAQETMLRVFQGLPRFNGRYLLRAWVARIATNVCLDALRRRTRRPGEIDSPDAEDMERAEAQLGRGEQEDPGALLERREESREVRELLGSLPDHHRDALLMREFHGMSHEAIGDALGMTAPQVKALLHRAKKGFKRAWEVKADRASAFAWPALAFPLRFLRRLVTAPRTATEAARSIASESIAPVVQLSVQPVVQQAAGPMAERVTAAAGALLIAGTIGIGATALPHHARPHLSAPAKPAAAAPVTRDATSPSPRVVIVESAPPASASASPTASSPAAHRGGRGPQSGHPSPSESPDSTEVQPAPPPATDGSSDPTPSPTPKPPAYSMSFTTSDHTGASCGCSSEGRLVENDGTSGTPGGSMRFGQGAQGAVVDADGNAAYGLDITYRGTVGGSSGNLNVDFRVTSGGGRVDSYVAKPTVTRVTQTSSSWVYTFAGTYAFSAGQSAGTAPLGSSGSFKVTLKFWSDGTIYSAVFSAAR